MQYQWRAERWRVASFVMDDCVQLWRVAGLADGSFGPAIGIRPFDVSLRPHFGEI